MLDPLDRRSKRVPPPLFPRRIASGRGATEQPNACGDGAAALTPRFRAAVDGYSIYSGRLASLPPS